LALLDALRKSLSELHIHLRKLMSNASKTRRKHSHPALSR
jgi:hypothetical protein